MPPPQRTSSIRRDPEVIQSFRGVLRKAETITDEGILGRCVPADPRRPVILDVSMEGLVLHDLGAEARELAAGKGSIRGIEIPLEFVTGWIVDAATQRVTLVLSKDMETFKRLKLFEIDAKAVEAALLKFGQQRASYMEDEHERNKARESARRSAASFNLSRFGSMFSSAKRFSVSDLQMTAAESSMMSTESPQERAAISRGSVRRSLSPTLPPIQAFLSRDSSSPEWVSHVDEPL